MFHDPQTGAIRPADTRAEDLRRHDAHVLRSVPQEFSGLHKQLSVEAGTGQCGKFAFPEYTNETREP